MSTDDSTRTLTNSGRSFTSRPASSPRNENITSGTGSGGGSGSGATLDFATCAFDFDAAGAWTFTVGATATGASCFVSGFGASGLFSGIDFFEQPPAASTSAAIKTPETIIGLRCVFIF
ncbi:hypothetical protein CMV30_12270 [Nibricoccus aquaticus]|uniref:Uncharacterized protein n=1 Tax=Nibricoccus aquaticus TaxID=2576891 RepID=A0A290QH41_9BACT|nr:hypothetical protein [Nibricoccus aquaticus]ATC64668.1 hypothetical protein CMV30_12270 [Nibricoccus aquaticus]